jgi:hypothetical protein
MEKEPTPRRSIIRSAEGLFRKLFERAANEPVAWLSQPARFLGQLVFSRRLTKLTNKLCSQHQSATNWNTP